MSYGVFQVESDDQAEGLARHLLDPGRERPEVVVTRAAGQPSSYVDPMPLAENLRGLADVWEMPTGRISWVFAHHLPARCEVYGGAAWVYPPGIDWADDPYSVPLRFVMGPADGPAMVEQLTLDAMRVARAETSTGTRPRSSVEVQGWVRSSGWPRGAVWSL